MIDFPGGIIQKKGGGKEIGRGYRRHGFNLKKGRYQR
jgi:hypothetical protein